MFKSKIKFSTIIIIFLIGFLISYFNSSSLLVSSNDSTNTSEKDSVFQALITHGPIYIDYDSNFSDYGFPGTGIAGDPYRIENYNITILGDYPILFSGNNTAYFIIQNCFLKTNTNTGIYLGKYYDMGEGTVEVLNNRIISDTQSGIILNGGNNSVISGNTITSKDIGIEITDSHYSEFSENIIDGNNGFCIDYYLSSNSIITKNNCSEATEGITISYSSLTEVTHNNCSYNSDGISFFYADNITMKNNIMMDNSQHGLSMLYSDYSLLTNNLFQDNSNYGITLNSQSDKNTLHHNAFVDNGGSTSQAEDDGSDNIFYDILTSEGNFWSEWISGTYSIDGSAGSVDLYPLNSMPVISEYSGLSLVILLTSYIVIISLTNLYSRKKKR
jgi:parallel beta-helix repeat protein